MTVLVTGGAGYIGAHVVLACIDAGRRVVVLDDLRTGFRAAVPSGAAFVPGDVTDRALVERVLRDHAVTAVMHFAASTVVPQSVSQPLAYWRNNAVGTLALAEACVAGGVRRIVFSSTAAVYGDATSAQVCESDAVRPASPYAASKLAGERVLRDAEAAGLLDVAVLRYFNVAGADRAGRAGQSTSQATHLIKVACQTALGLRPALEIFGDAWPTFDGTGVRDFVHVEDLAAAHLLALGTLEAGRSGLLLNCGSGDGWSVREVVVAVEAASGRRLATRVVPPRPGDLARVVADIGLIRRELDWGPRLDLGAIVADALAWERRLKPPAA